MALASAVLRAFFYCLALLSVGSTASKGASADKTTALVDGVRSLQRSTQTLCGVNTAAASKYLADAQESIRAATEGCKGPANEHPEITCGVPVADVVKSFLEIASFLAGAANQCMKAMNLDQVMENMGVTSLLGSPGKQAQCAEVIAGIAAGLGRIVSGSLKLSKTCGHFAPDVPPVEPEPEPEAAPAPVERRLTDAAVAQTAGDKGETETEMAGGDEDEPASNDDGVLPAESDGKAMCNVDAAGALVMVIRAATTINLARASCAEHEQSCPVDVGTVIEAFSSAAESISLAVSHCSLNLHIDQTCAGSVAGLLSGLGQITAMGVAIRNECPFVNQSLSGNARLFDTQSVMVMNKLPQQRFTGLAGAAAGLLVSLAALLTAAAVFKRVRAARAHSLGQGVSVESESDPEEVDKQ